MDIRHYPDDGLRGEGLLIVIPGTNIAPHHLPPLTLAPFSLFGICSTAQSRDRREATNSPSWLRFWHATPRA